MFFNLFQAYIAVCTVKYASYLIALVLTPTNLKIIIGPFSFTVKAGKLKLLQIKFPLLEKS